MDLKVSLLAKSHHRIAFDCGKELLNQYLKKQASQDVKRKLTVCFVLSDDQDNVHAYYSLSSSSIPQKDIPTTYAKKLPNSYTSLPVTLLGRLAVDQSVSGRGYGEHLLLHALWTAYKTSKEAIGSIAVVVDPIDEDAIKFYQKYGFILLPSSGKMFLPMNTIAQLFPSK